MFQCLSIMTQRIINPSYPDAIHPYLKSDVKKYEIPETA